MRRAVVALRSGRSCDRVQARVCASSDRLMLHEPVPPAAPRVNAGPVKTKSMNLPVVGSGVEQEARVGGAPRA